MFFENGNKKFEGVFENNLPEGKGIELLFFFSKQKLE